MSPSSANIWKIILYLPSSSAGRSTPPREAIVRSPVTASSRTTITTTIHAGPHDQHARDYHLVRERIEELPEHAGDAAPAGEVAVEEIGDAGEEKAGPRHDA